MASRYDYLSDALGFLHDARRADVLSLARGDAQLAKKLTDAASMDDGGKSLRAIVADMQWGRSPAVPAPEAPVQRATREPVSGMEWSARPDSYVQRTARDMADSLPPELAARVRAGDVEAAYEAIRRGPPRAGKKPPSTEDSIRELAKPPDQVAAEGIASQFDRATGAVPERQMELPLGDDPTGMIPYGVRGPGVMVDPGTGMIPAGGSPATEMISPSTGLGRPRLPRLPDKRLSTTVDLERMPHPRPVVSQPGPRRLPGTVDGETFPGVRVIDEPKPRGNRLAKAAAAAAAAGGAAYWASQNGKDVTRSATAEESAVESGGEADLAAETSPPPAVAATADVPEPTVAQAPQDYSLQARKLIDRLNDMRRAAGGEVPEAPAMMREINRLLALGNQTRRATYVAAPQDEAGRLYQQAQGLIDQVNQLQSQGYPHGSPQVQRLMAQVRQLQAQGDAMRNRRAG